jgi:hypothetical protein
MAGTLRRLRLTHFGHFDRFTLLVRASLAPGDAVCEGPTDGSERL